MENGIILKIHKYINILSLSIYIYIYICYIYMCYIYIYFLYIYFLYIYIYLLCIAWWLTNTCHNWYENLVSLLPFPLLKIILSSKLWTKKNEGHLWRYVKWGQTTEQMLFFFFHGSTELKCHERSPSPMPSFLQMRKLNCL